MNGVLDDGPGYEITDDGVVYQESELEDEGEDEGKGEESDPLASDADEPSHDRDAREEIFGASIDDLLAEARAPSRSRKRRRTGTVAKRLRRRPCEIPPHASFLMGGATLAYARRHFDAAEETLNNVIKEAPKAAAPYRLLGLIHEERGNMKKALEAYMAAANLDRSDRILWKRNAALAEELGELDQAIFCVTMAMKGMGGRDKEALRARGDLWKKKGLLKKAADQYVKVVRLDPSEVTLVSEIMRLYRQLNMTDKAVPVLQLAIDHVQKSKPRSDAGNADDEADAKLFTLIQYLVELWVDMQNYSDSASLLARMQERCVSAGKPMPFVKRLLLAICHYRLGLETLASPTFIEFLSSPSMMEKHKNLLWEVAEAYYSSKEFGRALKAYNFLAEHDDYENNVRLLMHRAVCHKEVNDTKESKSDLLKVLSLEPRNVEASMRFCDFFDMSYEEVKKKAVLKRRRQRRAEATINARVNEPRKFIPLLPRLSGPGRATLSDFCDSSAVFGGISDDKEHVPIPREDSDLAAKILARAESLFDSGQMQAFLDLVGLPIKKVLGITVNLGDNGDAQNDGNDGDDGDDDDDDDTDDDDDDEDEKFLRKVCSSFLRNLDYARPSIFQGAQVGSSINGSVVAEDLHNNMNEECTPKSTSLVRGPPVNQKACLLPTTEGLAKVAKRRNVSLEVPIRSEGLHCSGDLAYTSGDFNFSKEKIEENEENAAGVDIPVTLPKGNEQRLNNIGFSILRDIDNNRFALLLEKVFAATYRLRYFESIDSLMTGLFSLAAIRFDADSPLKLRMEVLLVVCLFACRRIYTGYCKLREMLWTTPNDSRICCLFGIAEEHLGIESASMRMKSFRALERLARKSPKLPMLMFMMGLCNGRALNNAHNYTVGTFLRVRDMVPDSPLVSLLLVVHLLYVAQSRRAGNRNQMVMHALTFLDEYRRKRKEHLFSEYELPARLEIEYNIGRAFHQLGLLHMASDMYRSILDCDVVGIDRIPAWADLRRDAAYNLA